MHEAQPLLRGLAPAGKRGCGASDDPPARPLTNAWLASQPLKASATELDSKRELQNFGVVGSCGVLRDELAVVTLSPPLLSVIGMSGR